MKNYSVKKGFIIGIIVIIILTFYPVLNFANFAQGSISYNSPPYPPTIVGPDYGVVGIEYKYNFSSTDPEGEDIYYYINWGDGTFLEWIGPYPSGNVVTLVHTWEIQGTFTIRAKAKDIHNAESDWSEFEVKIVGNQPPDAPTIDGPNIGKPLLEYNFTFKSCDPEDDDVYYLIYWGDGETSDWSGPYPSCQIAEISHKWSKPGNYNIRAKAKDIYDTESDLSDPYEVVIVNEPPNAPNITGQTRGETGKEYEYTFIASDPDGDNIRYFIDWGDTNSELTGFNASDTNVTVKHTWFKMGGYTITVKAIDIYGAEGPDGTLLVNIPRTKSSIFYRMNWLFEYFLLLQRILNWFLIAL